MRSIRIHREAAEAIRSHARADAPIECCGLLIGAPGRIDAALRARNLLASPTRFHLDPEDHFAAIKQARARGLSVVGVYHSHPASRPVPSPRDLDEASDPDFVYVIAGGAEVELRGYRLCEGNFRAVHLVPFS
jgi:proteasome lid subunit RPN8/RPN11